MIEIKNLVKYFGDTKAVNNLSLTINDGSIFGLVGSNGAGKSTILRLLSGIYKQDSGEIKFDSQDVYENNEVKDKIFFVSDFPLFLSNRLYGCMKFYSNMYSGFDIEYYNSLVEYFSINQMDNINKMSKGMQRQCAIIIALSCKPRYIFFDEIFDGLDPVKRESVKRLVIDYITKNDATVIVASHNLRELEGFCDHLGMLHNGEFIHEGELDNDKYQLQRVQLIAQNDDIEALKNQLNILNVAKNGRVYELTIRGERNDIEEKVVNINPTFYEFLDITLEEIFISEMEGIGYEIKEIK